MRRLVSALVCGAFVLTTGAALADVKGGKIDGKKEFMEHCAACHKDGGNIINPAKTLKKSDREANGIKSAKDIVKVMRNPGPGMTKFDKKTIPDSEAKAIADYVIKTF
jgi:cytochrome c6